MEKISVCLRIRPLNQKEINDNEIVAWDANDSKIQLNKICLKELIGQKKVVNSLIYEFNNCYGQQADNYYLFSTSVKQVIMQSLDGINGTVIMYGQTGSGKTFTMLGKRNQEMLYQNNNNNIQQLIKDSFANNQYNDVGILIYSMMELFKQINIDEKRQFEIKCSYYEIYNEFIYDLLREENELSEPLIFGTDYRKEFVIKNIKEFNVTSIEDVISCISKGEKNRHYAETILNHQSSRSHTIFKVLISAYSNESEEEENFTFSTEACINFIDLAGSEKISSSPISDDNNRNSNRKDRNKESSAINKSLFFLTRVIALKTQKVPPQHIPYRNSTLTKLLKSSLIGNFKTLILLSINPGLSQYDQTQSTLRFGLSAKLVESKVEQNVNFDASYSNNQQKLNQLIQKNKQNEKIISDQQKIIDSLKQQLQSLNCSEILTNIKQTELQLVSKPSVSQFNETDVSLLEKTQELNTQLQQEIEKNVLLEKNCTELHKRLQKSNEQILTYFNSHKEMEQQIKELKVQNEKYEKLSQNALNRLSCYEGQPNFKKFSLEELQNLEHQIQQCLQDIKIEKQRRNSFQQLNIDAMPLFTQPTETLRSDRSSASQDFRRIEEEDSIPKSYKKTPKKEGKQIQPKKQQQSYFKATSNRLSTLSNNENKSPLLKKPNLRDAKNFVKKIQDDKNQKPKKIQQDEHRSRSNESHQQQESQQPEQHKLKSDIQSLADRLYSLSEKFQLNRDSRVSQSRKSTNMNRTDIIYETESELLGESRTTIHKSNRSAMK
ncbi:unnamed protein product [Paramecium sonneborni]|uniref:Kinesin motor domain-containing protein n=1 Tax=Paramecium sonneborni TaxID=65129 RepID=A0A8S1R2S0_9CILI|nr:unnamed protein product [Paramecium sonneborni]